MSYAESCDEWNRTVVLYLDPNASDTSRVWTPFERLLYDMLIEAWRSAWGTATGEPVDRKTAAILEARRWIASDTEANAFTFLGCCKQLGIDPLMAREAMLHTRAPRYCH